MVSLITMPQSVQISVSFPPVVQDGSTTVVVVLT